MNILLIEDETAAAKHLQNLVAEVAPQANVMAVLESVREAVEWLRNHTPDLIISDIQLADGNSFNIFTQVQVHTPVIFTTAYDEYMQRAFKVNSIDYLLKPIDKEELAAAFNKYKMLNPGADNDFYNKLAGLLKYTGNTRSRFLVKTGDKYWMVATEDVAYLRADNKVVFLHTYAGQKYIINESLDELEKTLDPLKFFRLNRSYFAAVDAISQIHTHFNGRLKIELKGSDDDEIFISKEKATSFKQWLNT